MPSFEADDYGVSVVAQLQSFLSQVLQDVTSVKPETEVEPPLPEADIEEALKTLPTPLDGTEGRQDEKRLRHFAAMEMAARGLFSNFVANTDIDSPEFVKVWNFFDILSFLSDRGQCDPALLVWLVEELLDSQTIAGCHTIFDYLESRRQRIISKNFADKKLVILRSCNELLRRLSRAEDTAFSGRVFIFLFQSFPLGDKSSVNLRGEYHTQNVTTYDEATDKTEDTPEKMDVDPPAESKANGNAATELKKPASQGTKPHEQTLDTNALYSVFWSLQEKFNQPKKLFDSAQLAQFKTGLESTLAAFTTLEQRSQSHSSRSLEDAKRGTKRRREGDSLDEDNDDLTTAFNPRYLTSRALFDLELSDLSFRRYILVQSLITMDFLLSLTPSSKEKLTTIPSLNKSVAYLEATISDEDAAWAITMKRALAEHIVRSSDGAFFLRMVETVLSRDRNWVRWKVENCPPIERPSVSADAYAAAMKRVRTNTTNRPMRRAPLKALNVDFLQKATATNGGISIATKDEEQGWKELRQPERYEVPALASYRNKILEQDLEIEMPDSKEAETQARESKASMTWRALRMARKGRLADFDRIEKWEDIGVVFGDSEKKDEMTVEEPAES